MICHSDFTDVIRDEMPCCTLSGKSFDDVFITRLSQLSRKRDRLRRILLLFQRKGVCIHTTEIDLRYDLYRHGLDNVLVGGF